MRPEEQDLADAARVLAGDTAAFAGIVERWQGRLLNLAWRYTRDRAAAEDMTQEVLLKVFRSLGSFRGQAAFSTWVTAIAFNTCRSRVQTWGPPHLGLERDTPSPGQTQLHRLEQRERNEMVQRAVFTLPERYRDAILLFYFEEKDLAETARVLGVSEGTLKSRLHRGRELLRQRCGKLADSAGGSAIPASGILEET